MRTETKIINIYRFDELSEEVKEKLIQQEMQSQLEFYCETYLLEDMEEKAKELIKQYFGDKAIFINTYYDLDYSQGRGAMIEFEASYCGKSFRVKQRGFYYHERAFEIIETIDEYFSRGFTQGQYLKLKEKIVAMNRELVSYGDSIIEDEEMFKEQALEYLQEQEFTEDGEIY